ncbi:rRNA-processing protein fcf2 [Paramyrothecium foliicola]|nr:rRNA-processing protein fcf2 [Paramyrothecium foliicola]
MTGQLLGNMAGIIGDELDALLREAEQRLQGVSTSVQPPRKTAPAFGMAPNTLPSQTAKEDLSMRQIQQPLQQQASKKDTAGSNWFQLPKTEVTPELKRDWQLLRMRNVLDPKHQKKNLRATLPEYSQVGEIIAGPTEFYSARLTRKERKRTLLEEAMASHDPTKLRTKYAGIQRTKSSGKKAFYEKVKSQRRKKGY